MMNNFNAIGFESLVRRELKRTFSIINQVIWPPLISTLLYVLVIGMSLGGRIEMATGVPYLAYLIPGLIALTVIDSSYAESSASLFQHRFMGSIQELLIAPLASYELVAGFMIGSAVRALMLGNLLLLFLPVFTGRWPAHWLLYLLLMLVLSVLFSAVGLIMGLLAEKWDHVAIPTTFVFTPLIWVGGAFTPLVLLPEPLRLLAWANPMFYLVDAFRFSVVGVSEAPLWASIGVTVTLATIATGVVLKLFESGSKLRT